jgi:hypothetical protein
MKSIKVFAALLFGVFILQSCEKEQIEPKKELTKLEYLKQITGSDNFIISADKDYDAYIRDSLKAEAYKYYPDENDISISQDLIIINDGKIENEDDIITAWWIEIVSLGTLSVYGQGNYYSINCIGSAVDCANVLFMGNAHIMF